MTVLVDRGAGDAANFEDLAAVGKVAGKPLRPIDAETLLVDVDVDRILGVENVVERDQHNARGVGALDHRLERLGILRVGDDRVISGIDEIVDRGDLRGDVLAGRDDLELLKLGGDIGLRRIGLGGLDHLDAPGVGDESVGERDAIGPLLGGIFEILRLIRPRRVALWIGRRARYDLGSGGVGGRGECARGGGHAAGGGDGDKAIVVHGHPPSYLLLVERLDRPASSKPGRRRERSYGLRGRRDHSIGRNCRRRRLTGGLLLR